MEEAIVHALTDLESSARDFEELLAIATESHSAGRLSPIEVGYLLQQAQSVLTQHPGEGLEAMPRIDPRDFARSPIRERRRQIRAARLGGYQHLRRIDPSWRPGILGRRANRLALMITAICVAGVYLVIASQLANWNPFSWTQWTLGPVRILDFDQRWWSIALHRADENDSISIDGKTYPVGIGVQAPSRIEIQVIAGGDRFSGLCGLPDTAVHGRILCRVLAGEAELFASPPLSSEHRLTEFSVPIPADRRLILEVQSTTTSLRDAEGAWVDLHAD